MNEQRIRQIVREEVYKVLKEGGVAINEDAPKKGSRVNTPFGKGVVLNIMSNQVKVKLDAGNIMKVHRDRAHVIG